MKRSSSSKPNARALVLSAFVIAGIAAACSSGSAASQGAESGPCYPNDTCNDKLVCKAGTCVRAEGIEGGDCYPNNTCNDKLVCKAGTCVHDEGAGGSTSSGTGGAGSSSSGSGTTGGAGGATTGSTSSSSTTTGSSSSGSPPVNQPPVILSFGTNVTSLTQGEQVTFSAVVTDPDGIDDVIGGTLLDAGGATYGAFGSSAQEGAYQMILSWDQLHQVAPINFAQGATATRTFKAQFFDQAGHTVEKTVDVTLTCNGKAACSGTCVDLMTSSQSCGTCGHACSGGNCSQGKCPSLSGCLPKSNLTTCQNYCASQGKTCTNTCFNPYGGGATVGGLTFGNTTCTQYSGTAACSASISTAQSSRCCCAQ